MMNKLNFKIALTAAPLPSSSGKGNAKTNIANQFKATNSSARNARSTSQARCASGAK